MKRGNDLNGLKLKAIRERRYPGLNQGGLFTTLVPYSTPKFSST